MSGGGYEEICGTITNTLATLGGMLCDGAKSSCAAKIATAVQTALLAAAMSAHGRRFRHGDGIVTQDVEETIADINRKLAGIETILLFTEPELTCVSSTIVRELLTYNKDISQFIPEGMEIN